MGLFVFTSCSKETVSDLNVMDTPFYLQCKLNGAEWNTQGSYSCPSPTATMRTIGGQSSVLFESISCDTLIQQIGGTILDFHGEGTYLLNADTANVFSYWGNLSQPPMLASEGELKVKFIRFPQEDVPGFMDITFYGKLKSFDGSTTVNMTKGEARLLLVNF